nr:maleylpyruvate isomerase N-terminal domain-containing protein [Streptomyces sp. NBC_01571]
MDVVRSGAAPGRGAPFLGRHRRRGACRPAKSAPKGAPAAPREREAVSAWLAASTQRLLDTLREAGPDRGCWTWWGASQSPRACGAVARHQLQEIAAHLRRPGHRGCPGAAAG